MLYRCNKLVGSNYEEGVEEIHKTNPQVPMKLGCRDQTHPKKWISDDALTRMLASVKFGSNEAFQRILLLRLI